MKSNDNVNQVNVLPQVVEVVCPLCNSIVKLYGGNKVGMHTPHSNVSEQICRMVGAEIKSMPIGKYKRL